MKRSLAVLGALGLLMGSTLTAHADGIPLADSGSIPACGNIIDGSGTWAPPKLTMKVVLEAAPCDGSTAEARYDLYAILDKPSGTAPDPAEPHSFDVGEATDPQLLTSDFVLSEDGTTLTYEVNVLEETDLNICVFSVVHGTVPVTTTTTTTTTDEGDYNGNGKMTDDKHRRNEGDNSDGAKHDWDETTTTTTTTTHEPFVNRAPADASNTDPMNCFPLNPIYEAYKVITGSPSRGYN